MTTLAAILAEVAAKYRLTIIDLRSDSRAKRVTDARGEFYYRALRETTCSSPTIGWACRKTHGTVLKGAAVYARRNGLEIPRGATSRGYPIRDLSSGRYVSATDL